MQGDGAVRQIVLWAQVPGSSTGLKARNCCIVVFADMLFSLKALSLSCGAPLLFSLNVFMCNSQEFKE